MPRPKRYTPTTSAYAHRAHFADQQAAQDPRKRAYVNEAESLKHLADKRRANK